MTPTTPTTPAIDFADIRSRCPRAFAALIGWFCQGKHFQLGAPTIDSPDEATAEWGPYVSAGVGRLEVGDFRDQYTLNVRDLFEFFDASGLYVGVFLDTGYSPVMFTGTLGRAGKRTHMSCGDHPSRAAAEADAFTAGFAKLEEMLGKEEER